MLVTFQTSVIFLSVMSTRSFFNTKSKTLKKLQDQDQDQDLALQDQDQDLSSQDKSKIKTFADDAQMLKYKQYATIQ
jgi:hypothetical protein